MADRPVIAITGPDGCFPVAWWATRLAILIAGGTAVRLTPSNSQEHDKERFQGIIIGGGSDIDAGLYGGENPDRNRIDSERDIFESEMIRHALDTDLPILGICRGAQLINVVLGGSLFPDIRPMRRRTSNRRTPLPRKTAIAESDGVLPDAMNCEKWRINSLHYQAIDRLGEGLLVTARDLDSFVQSIESTSHRWLVGVQWHPEYLIYMKSQRRIFGHLVKRARECAAESLNPDEEK